MARLRLSMKSEAGMYNNVAVRKTVCILKMCKMKSILFSNACMDLRVDHFISKCLILLSSQPRLKAKTTCNL